MPIGDGVRRNVESISQEERNRLRDAIIALQNKSYPGERDDGLGPSPGGVTYWFKQDEIHQATHVHSFQGEGTAFLPWHRELINRFEALLREEDPELSLHYWDWTTNPSGLFTSDFMGSANGPAGEPWLSAGFYDPNADPFRSNKTSDPVNNNPFDPPRTLSRNVQSGAPSSPSSDQGIIDAATFHDMRLLLENVHNGAHTPFIGGTIGNPHTSFRDPFVFLLHSNVDRLFAMWQTVPGQEWRLDPDQVYGSEATDPEILEDLEPWAGNPNYDPNVDEIRPWAPPENQQVPKKSTHTSIVAPPLYDTLPTVVAPIVVAHRAPRTSDWLLLSST